MATKYHSKLPFPKDNFVLQVTSATFGPSSKNTPMVTLELEISSPDTYPINGEDVVVAGTKLKVWKTFESRNKDGSLNEEKTAKMKPFTDKFFADYGIDPSTVDMANIDTRPFEGRKIHALLYDDETEQRKDPTPAQIKAGQEGDVIKNPITGKPNVFHRPAIAEVYGPAESTGSAV